MLTTESAPAKMRRAYPIRLPSRSSGSRSHDHCAAALVRPNQPCRPWFAQTSASNKTKEPRFRFDRKRGSYRSTKLRSSPAGRFRSRHIWLLRLQCPAFHRCRHHGLGLGFDARFRRHARHPCPSWRQWRIAIGLGIVCHRSTSSYSGLATARTKLPFSDHNNIILSNFSLCLSSLRTINGGNRTFATLTATRRGSASHYSAIASPEPPNSAGKSFNLGKPSRMGSTVSA
jgi:hypothetical protein